MSSTTKFVAIEQQLESQRKKVDVDHFDVTVRELIRMAESNELIRSPEYQRKFRWSEADEAKLIESLFLGLPVPSIFVATNPDGKWELVDGLQRVSTLLHYAGNEEILPTIEQKSHLTLTQLEKLPGLNELTFADLSKTLQLLFYKRFIRVTALSDKSDKEVRFDMFERLNTGGIILTPQEVRACVYRGQFSDFIRELASSNEFASKLKLQKKRQQDGTREEQILKFFAYLYNRQKFDGQVKKFLNDYMEEASKNFNYAHNTKLFYQVLSIIDNYVDGPVLRDNVHVTPQVQFEAIMVGLGEMLLEGQEIQSPPDNWLNDPKLVKYTTGGTNTTKKLRERIKRVKQLFSNQVDDN